MIEAIRVAVHVDAGDALVAREAARHRMLSIGRQRDERLALDARDQPASRLADAAEGVDLARFGFAHRSTLRVARGA